jgi:hypothetical protein
MASTAESVARPQATVFQGVLFERDDVDEALNERVKEAAATAKKINGEIGGFILQLINNEEHVDKRRAVVRMDQLGKTFLKLTSKLLRATQQA